MKQLSERILHFSLGPVQGFVAQARRTRDLWGGSFLLSWLAGHAMKAVIDHGGKVVFPVVHNDTKQPTDPLLKAIMQGIGKPRIGTLPNRFKANVPGDFDPKFCTEAIHRKWNDLCAKIYEKYVDPVITGDQVTMDIWQRQIQGFWEINWVCDEDPGDKSDSTWLDLRKNWRSQRPPDEGGDHCMIMGDWQELSGFVRSTQRGQQDQFWKRFRNQPGIGKYDLRDDERLCAIAVVKRLFPTVAKEVIGWDLNIRNWPSTAYMAALHWLPAAWEVDRSACLKYSTIIQSSLAEGVYGEKETRISCLDEIADADGEFRKFSGLDGSMFHVHALANEKLTPLKESSAPEVRQKLTEMLGVLKKKTDIGITSYYAFLIMDGDKMGVLLRDYPTEVSKGLAEFTGNVERIVSDYNGVTVYAGGDDVLAMFPLDDAIIAAHKLRQAYSAAFDNASWASISAAIVYAHHHQPLRSVLHHAHQQLDGIAKNKNGRDSLAIAVLKGGDVNASWVSCWEPATEFFPAIELKEMADVMSSDQQFSSRFLYVLRDRFKDLLDQKGRVVPGIDMGKILLAEYLRNREKDTGKDDAQIIVQRLVRAVSCHPKENPNPQMASLQPDGPVILRFLANRGVHE